MRPQVGVGEDGHQTAEQQDQRRVGRARETGADRGEPAADEDLVGQRRRSGVALGAPGGEDHHHQLVDAGAALLDLRPAALGLEEQQRRERRVVIERFKQRA